MQVLLAVFDRSAAAALAHHFRSLGWVCEGVPALSGIDLQLRHHRRDLLVLELSAAGATCEQAERLAGRLPVVAVALPQPELFFRAARAGVVDILPLPLDDHTTLSKLQSVNEHLLAHPPAANRLPTSFSSVEYDQDPEPKALHATIPSMFATSEEMGEVREMIEKVAPTSAAVLLRGESGVGKELAARLIHSLSLRARQAFVKVNCAAIPNDLLESELFGYETGAFTGATHSKPGKFELADGGTIFLDEIGEMHPMLQAKLLHVLQDGDFARLGSKRDLSVDVRVICATNQPLDILVADGRFREDLYYRVNVITIHLPPLRARRQEIPQLLDYFVRRYARMYNKPAVPFEAETIAFFTGHDWPGNIRELENLCKRYVIVGGVTQILRDIEARKQKRTHEPIPGVPAAIHASSDVVEAGFAEVGPSLIQIGKRAAWAAERTAIEVMLQETNWNRREAAKRLQVSYKALLNKIQSLECEKKS